MIRVNRRKKFGVLLEDVFFAENISDYTGEADIVTFYQCKEPYKNCQYFYTIKIDITQSSEEIFKTFSKSTRYAINRVKKNSEFHMEIIEKPSDGELVDFMEYYNRFARAKRIPLVNYRLIRLLRDQNAFIITYMRDKNNKIWYCNTAILDEGNTIRGLHGCSGLPWACKSEEKRKIGCAGRYLEYHLFLLGKERGCQTADLGGIVKDARVDTMGGINQYKRGFGGEEYLEYKFYYPKTLKGRVALWIFNKNNRDL